LYESIFSWEARSKKAFFLLARLSVSESDLSFSTVGVTVSGVLGTSPLESGVDPHAVNIDAKSMEANSNLMFKKLSMNCPAPFPFFSTKKEMVKGINQTCPNCSDSLDITIQSPSLPTDSKLINH
jgi:hypothetical protein